MAEHFETELEKKISKTFNKFKKMLDFNANLEALELFEFDRCLNICTNLNSVAVEITETIEEGYKEFNKGDLLLVKDFINLLYLHFHLSNQITVVASYIEDNFDDEGYPKTDKE